MRYLVCSDIHLNLNRRFDDTVAALNQITEIIEREMVHKVLILGDTFTSRRPHSKELTTFERWISRITNSSRASFEGWPQVVIIRGNHDEFPDGTHSYHAFEELRIPNVKIYSNPHIEDGIFMGHFLLREATIGPTDYKSMESMSVDELIAKYPNCIAYMLGDVHKHQVLSEEPPVIYAGSIEHVDFGERKDEKGVILLEITDNTRPHTYRFIPLKTRPMLQYDLYPPFTTFPTRIEEGAIVKVIFHGTKEEIANQVNESDVHSLFVGTKELVVQYDITKDVAPRNKQVNESITPEKALELYFDKKELPEAEKKSVMALGLEIIRQCQN